MWAENQGVTGGGGLPYKSSKGTPKGVNFELFWYENGPVWILPFWSEIKYGFVFYDFQGNHRNVKTYFLSSYLQTIPKEK